MPGTGYGLGCVWGDYDNDGFPDLFVTQYGRNALYRNNGNGTFTDVTVEADKFYLIEEGADRLNIQRFANPARGKAMTPLNSLH